MKRKTSLYARGKVREISPWLQDKILERQRAARALILEKNLAGCGMGPGFPTQDELDALERCFERARGCSGGQSRVRRFLLSWQSTGTFGGFDVTDLWSLDEHYGGDLMTVLKMINRGPGGWYPAHYGFRKELDALIAEYRPGDYKSERCHKCGVDVAHVCDEAGHQRREAERRLEDERERRERDRVWRDKPYGVCESCTITLEHEPIGRRPLCDLCIDHPYKKDAGQ